MKPMHATSLLFGTFSSSVIDLASAVGLHIRGQKGLPRRSCKRFAAPAWRETWSPYVPTRPSAAASRIAWSHSSQARSWTKASSKFFLFYAEQPRTAPAGRGAGRWPQPGLATACARRLPATDGRCVSPVASVRPWSRRLRTTAANWQSPLPGTQLRRRPCTQLLASWFLWFPALTFSRSLKVLAAYAASCERSSLDRRIAWPRLSSHFCGC